MPQVIIYISEDEDLKIKEMSNKLNISKHDVIKKLIDKELKGGKN